MCAWTLVLVGLSRCIRTHWRLRPSSWSMAPSSRVSSPSTMYCTLRHCKLVIFSYSPKACCTSRSMSVTDPLSPSTHSHHRILVYPSLPTRCSRHKSPVPCCRCHWALAPNKSSRSRMPSHVTMAKI